MIRTPPSLSTARLDEFAWARTAGPFRALAHAFVVRTMDPALGRYLEAVLDPFADGCTDAPAYSVVDRGETTKNRYALYYGHERLALTPSGSFAVATLLWHVNRGAISSGGEFVLVHAGAVEWDGHAVLFPAPMESGKTTLVAGMVRAGARYLSDEAAAIAPETLLVHPFPKALTIGAGSWGVLADLAPEVDPKLAQRYLRDDWHIDARAIRPDSLAPATLPSFVIAPTYVRDAATSLLPMTRAEAVMHLGQNSFNLPEHGRRGLEVLAAVVRRSTCHRLVVGDLDEACDLLRRVLSNAT
jgi:hypothetical protein